MSNPHVNFVNYKLIELNNTSFEDCLPIEYDNDKFSLKLENCELICTFKEHYSTLDSAKQEVEKLLRSWEIDSAIKNELREFKFVFNGAEVIDRDAAPGGEYNSSFNKL